MTTRVDIEHWRCTVDQKRRELESAESFVRRAEFDIETAERFLEKPYNPRDKCAEVRHMMNSYRDEVLPRCRAKADDKRREYDRAVELLDRARARYLKEDPSRVAYWEDEDETKRRGAVYAI